MDDEYERLLKEYIRSTVEFRRTEEKRRRQRYTMKELAEDVLSIIAYRQSLERYERARILFERKKKQGTVETKDMVKMLEYAQLMGFERDEDSFQRGTVSSVDNYCQRVWAKYEADTADPKSEESVNMLFNAAREAELVGIEYGENATVNKIRQEINNILSRQKNKAGDAGGR